MQKKPLIKLLHDLEQEMLRLGYTEGTMNFYRRRWQMLLQFAQERKEAYFSEQLGIDFVEKYFHILEKNFKQTLSQADTHAKPRGRGFLVLIKNFSFSVNRLVRYIH